MFYIVSVNRHPSGTAIGEAVGKGSTALEAKIDAVRNYNREPDTDDLQLPLTEKGFEHLRDSYGDVGDTVLALVNIAI